MHGVLLYNNWSGMTTRPAEGKSGWITELSRHLTVVAKKKGPVSIEGMAEAFKAVHYYGRPLSSYLHGHTLQSCLENGNLQGVRFNPDEGTVELREPESAAKERAAIVVPMTSPTKAGGGSKTSQKKRKRAEETPTPPSSLAPKARKKGGASKASTSLTKPGGDLTAPLPPPTETATPGEEEESEATVKKKRKKEKRARQVAKDEKVSIAPTAAKLITPVAGPTTSDTRNTPRGTLNAHNKKAGKRDPKPSTGGGGGSTAPIERDLCAPTTMPSRQNARNMRPVFTPETYRPLMRLFRLVDSLESWGQALALMSPGDQGVIQLKDVCSRQIVAIHLDGSGLGTADVSLIKVS